MPRLRVPNDFAPHSVPNGKCRGLVLSWFRESTYGGGPARILLEVADAGSPTGASLMQVLMTCPADVFPNAAQELGRFLTTITEAPRGAIPPAVATKREGSPCVQDPSVQDSSPRP